MFTTNTHDPYRFCSVGCDADYNNSDGCLEREVATMRQRLEALEKKVEELLADKESFDVEFTPTNHVNQKVRVTSVADPAVSLDLVPVPGATVLAKKGVLSLGNGDSSFEDTATPTVEEIVSSMENCTCAVFYLSQRTGYDPTCAVHAGLAKKDTGKKIS